MRSLSPLVCALSLLFACAASNGVSTDQHAQPTTHVTSSAPSEGSSNASSSAVTKPEAVLDEVQPTPQRTVTLAPGLVVRITPEGTGLIRVAVGISGSITGDVKVEVERHDPRHAAPAKGSLTRTSDSALHSAVSGVTYAYRFRAAAGEWTELVEARTARVATPPAAPTSLSVKAHDAFTTELAWEAETTATAGIEVEVEIDGEWTRTAVVDPTERVFQHRGRWPGATYAYRVRAFNAVGASAWSAPAEGSVPKLTPAPKLAKKLGPCVTLPKEAPETHAIGRDELRAAPDELINEPDANDGYTRHFFGRANGCLRDLGTTTAQANIDVVRGLDDDAAFPFLSVIAGAGSYVGAQLRFLRFDGARYQQVHEVLICGDAWVSDEPSLTFGAASGEDVRTFQPPFEVCQRDTDLRRD